MLNDMESTQIFKNRVVSILTVYSEHDDRRKTSIKEMTCKLLPRNFTNSSFSDQMVSLVCVFQAWIPKSSNIFGSEVVVGNEETQ